MTGITVGVKGPSRIPRRTECGAGASAHGAAPAPYIRWAIGSANSTALTTANSRRALQHGISAGSGLHGDPMKVRDDEARRRRSGQHEAGVEQVGREVDEALLGDAGGRVERDP